MQQTTPNIVVVGVQWGDEGKGKIVDLLAARSDFVVRFQGGNNAGHTLVVEGVKTVLHLVPSGVLHGRCHCVVGNGVVLDPEVFVGELDTLARAGRTVGAEQLSISQAAHVILPFHRRLDEVREDARGGDKIGTTRKGIGPTYEDKVARRGIRMADFIDEGRLRSRLRELLPEKNRQLTEWFGADPFEEEELIAWARPLAHRLAPMVTDTVALLHEATAAGRPVLFEGAQGTFLDVDHGSYPFVTSSNTVSGAATTGTGLGPRDLHQVVGVAKAYATRVGAGPFPSELDDELGARLRELGGEYGATTGRPRRCGWFDATMVAKGARLNGLTALVLTKLDVLSGLDPLSIAFDDGAGGVRLEEHPGWTEDISACRTWESLPGTCQAYIRRIEELVGVPVGLASVGPGREAIIPVHPELSAWMMPTD